MVSVHLEAFPDFFMTALGPRFLREYYRCVAEFPGGVLLTEEDHGTCVGFVAGFLRPSEFYAELCRRRFRLALAAATGILVRPLRLPALLANYRRTTSASRQQGGAGTAELSSLAVRPSGVRRGLGSRLVRRFIECVTAEGAERVVLTTDAYGNDSVNRFYQRLGFQCDRCFEARHGRWLNDYSLNIRRD